MLFEMLRAVPFDAESPVSVALKQIQLERLRCAASTRTSRGLRGDHGAGDAERARLALSVPGEMLADIERFQQNSEARFEYKYLTDRQMEEGRYRRIAKT
jgi:serine/threonine-protein kinase